MNGRILKIKTMTVRIQKTTKNEGEGLEHKKMKVRILKTKQRRVCIQKNKQYKNPDPENKGNENAFSYK